MKRLHLHIKTHDLDRSVAFYTAMFGEAPTKREADYAKWLLEDPRANVSLSSRRAKSAGIDHVGVSVETQEELDAVAERLAGHADLAPEKAADCCYARSNKYWLKDPQGAVWELFQTYGESDGYGNEPPIRKTDPSETRNACCGA